MVRYNTLNIYDTLLVVRTIKGFNYNKGIVFHFGLIDIPPSEDSITIVVPLNINIQEYDGGINDKCDTLRFNMHRVDEKKLDFWNP